ncbi:hypothetical protein COT72_01225 [archaeon CG10_big_fil_rev_8_21_14_0_10_43_11]|nr:MAG: hypothetical protein COT72_01225 [archaeon CG10_big_fil_rev_8_21_14_0_10_43_11]
MRRTVIAGVLIVFALIPFAKLFIASQETGLSHDIGATPSISVTGNVVQAASEQAMSFLIKKDAIINFFVNQYDQGFFQVGNEDPLYATMIALETFSQFKYLNELSEGMVRTILARSRAYVSDAGELTPRAWYAYVRIQSILGSDVPKTEADAIISHVLAFKIPESGFAERTNASVVRASVLETYFAVRLFDELGWNSQSMKTDIITFLNEKQDFSEQEYVMRARIGEGYGVPFGVPRETLLACLVKEYLPTHASEECASALNDSYLFVYLPSAILIIAAYLLLIAR